MYKVTLPSKEIPKKWYNIISDLPAPLPPASESEEGHQLANLPKIFSKSVLEQEMSQEKWIKIPKKVRNVYKMIGRPSPLFLVFVLVFGDVVVDCCWLMSVVPMELLLA